MLYSEESVSIFNKCPLCQNKLKEATIIPCGVYCAQCVKELTKDADETNKEFECKSCKKIQFKCKSCRRIHIIPEDGFIRWNAFDEFNSGVIQLEDIYRGESIETLKNNLKEIDKQINEMSFSLNNGSDRVKEFCLKLRNEVTLETEVLIKHVQDYNEKLINEINDFEMRCIANINSDKVNIAKINRFLNETKYFHQISIEYLRKYKIQETVIVKANFKAVEFVERFGTKKKELEQFIFNNESILFRKNFLEYDKIKVGNLVKETIKSTIDIDKLQNLKLKDILRDFNDASSIYDFDAFQDGKIALIYANNSDNLSISIIDKNGARIKHNNTQWPIINTPMRFKTFKEFIFFYFHHDDNGHYLEKFSSDLKEIETKDFDYQMISLDVDRNYIYCLTNCLKNQIMIFDHDLENIKNIGQYESPQNPFYLTNDVKRIAYRNSSFYCLYPHKLDIINELDGKMTKSISIKGNSVAFDSIGNFMVLALSSSKIFVYNLDGVLQYEISLIGNSSNELDFVINIQDQLVLCNRTLNALYLK